MISARLRVEPLAAIQPGESFAQTWDRCAQAFGDVYYQRGYLAACALKGSGFEDVANLRGGFAQARLNGL